MDQFQLINCGNVTRSYGIFKPDTILIKFHSRNVSILWLSCQICMSIPL